MSGGNDEDFVTSARKRIDYGDINWFKKHSNEFTTKKDEVVTIGGKKYHYKDELYESHSFMSDNEGNVTLCEIDNKGKENGLFIRDFYYREEERGKEKGYTEICRMKDGQQNGPLYGFCDGTLMWVRIADKMVTSADERFKLYETIAPKFDETFKVLKQAKVIVDRRESSWVYRQLDKLQEKMQSKFKK